MIGARCTLAVERNGKVYGCELAEGHAGDHEATEAGQKALKPDGEVLLRMGLVRLAKTPYKTDGRAQAYALGAVHYATGLGLDRLAIDLGMKREKTESDHDLSARVAVALGVRKP